MFVMTCFSQVTLRSTKAVANPGTIVIDSIVTAHFDSVVSAQFLYKWDTSVVTFIDIIGKEKLKLVDSTNFFLKNISSGSFFFVYFPSSKITLPDSASIFKVRFYVKGKKGQSTVLKADEDIIKQQYLEIVQDSNNVTINRYPNIIPGYICVQECLPNSISTLDDKKIDIFPNPFSNSFQIRTDLEDIVDIQVLNALGQVTLNLTKQNIENQQEININLENHPKGLYLVNLKTKNRSYSQKLIKEID